MSQLARVLHRPKCPFCRRLRAYLTERGITDFELVRYDAERDHDALCRANPKAQVPTWETSDGLRLFESSIIMEFLEDSRPAGGLLDSDPATRATTRILFNLTDGPLVAPLKSVVNTSPDDPEHITGIEAFTKTLKMVEPRLHPDGPFALGSTFSMADLTTPPVILRALEGGLPPGSLSPRLAAWTRAVLSRPAVRELYPDVKLD